MNFARNVKANRMIKSLNIETNATRKSSGSKFLKALPNEDRGGRVCLDN